ncbi:MAG: hypothetical protein ACE5GW_07190 [Planctomycetota bacterium]
MSMRIYLKRSNTPLPPQGEGEIRYIVAENGIFMERRTSMFSTSCRVEQCAAGLDPHEEWCELHSPSLPPEMASRMLSFFRWAYCLHGGEAVLILLFNPEEERFLWHCPPQRVEVWEDRLSSFYGGGDIEYTNPLELPRGFVIFGDAHSHANMPAYASAVDQQDERFKAGLHIIVGRIHWREVELYADFVMDRQRFAVDPRVIFGEERIKNSVEVPEAWKQQVEVVKRRYSYSTWTSADRDGGSHGAYGSHDACGSHDAQGSGDTHGTRDSRTAGGDGRVTDEEDGRPQNGWGSRR